MPHEVTLITTIAAALGLALIMGFIAARLKLPALVGYLIAGIIIGPATPGFVADIELSGALACVLVRSPHAHARVRGIDTAAAKAMPGVVGVFTGTDMATDGMAPMRPLWAVRSRDGAPMVEPPRFAPGSTVGGMVSG